MKNTKPLSVRIGSAFAALVLIASYFTFLPTQNANAAQITNRSLTLQAGATDGGTEPGGVVNHLFNFTLVGGTDIASIKFEYCTSASATALLVCDLPTNLVTTNATLGNETGSTGWTMVNTTNGAPYLTKGTAAAASGPVSFRLDSITNPDTLNGETFFVRISTHTTTDGTGAPVDSGTVTASTNRPIVLTGTMPESLVFCTGATVSETLGVPDCSTVTTGSILFDQLFSPTDTATSTSQMAASTNAGFGYVITVNGTTLTSGANTIAPMNAQGTLVVGSGQFGLNLIENVTTTDANSDPLGTNVEPAPDGTNLKGEVNDNYNDLENFKFSSGDTVAASTNGGAGGSDAQIFTVGYIANVPGNQPAGSYTTTLTYICTPTF